MTKDLALIVHNGKVTEKDYLTTQEYLQQVEIVLKRRLQERPRL